MDKENAVLQEDFGSQCNLKTKEYLDLEQQFTKMKNLMSNERKKNRALEIKNKRLQSDQDLNSKKFKKNVSNFLQSKMSPSQIKCLVYDQKWARNTPIDIAKAAVQYSISPRAYEHSR